MSFALLLNKRGPNKPGKGENFGVKFTASFALESSHVKPYGCMSGQLIIESPAPILHYGIRIQYEALCTLKFESKLDNRISQHKKCGLILEGGEDKELVDGYLESPVMIDLEPVINADANENRPYELQPGTNTYGFNLTIPGDMLPSPFKNSYGTLQYKVVAYMKSENGILVQIGEKGLKFGGYYNLSQNPEALKPATIERSVKRSIFTGKKLVVATLNLENCGYLPDESLRFTMRVKNPKCLSFKMSVLLLQKVMYNINGTKKSTIAVLGNSDREVPEPEPETIWEGTVKVHKGASPTYTKGSSMYAVSHTVQFKLKLDDYNVLKADQTVFIGTTRETVEALIASVNSFTLESNRTMERRGSTSSMASNCSTTTVSKPPTYSQLSSRLPSIESFPPGYDDTLNENGDAQGATLGNEPIMEEDQNQNQTNDNEALEEKN